MAEITAGGLEECTAELQAAIGEIGGVVDAMLQAGADIVADSLRSAGSPHYRTGAMTGSIKKGSVSRKAERSSITVAPRDADQNGVRNAAKAYWTSVGRKGRVGDGWYAAGEAAANDAVDEVMKQIFDDMTEKKH